MREDCTATIQTGEKPEKQRSLDNWAVLPTVANCYPKFKLIDGAGYFRKEAPQRYESLKNTAAPALSVSEMFASPFQWVRSPSFTMQ
ncbi:hypothetical protein QE152_g13875 [Popillia japonica]|uniref:Uncharacterized protein n=1 Tax=Popillia japonica TaxID=7064 RepID=A0AAW1L9U0_POPJA